jgi:sugar phosphate isomerase/epimerase
MQDGMDRYLRMGLVHFMAFPQVMRTPEAWAETVGLVALDPFFKAVEITHIEEEDQRKRVKEICDLAGLAVGFGAHPMILGEGLNLNALEDKERLKAVGRMKELIDEALFFEAESFVVLSGKDPGEERRAEAVDRLAQSLGELCAYSGERQGPRIVAEVFDCDVDKCCLLGPAALARQTAEKVRGDHDNFGLLVDLSHIPILRESPSQAVGPVKDFMTAAHIGNAVLTPGLPAYGDHHPPFGTPGSAVGLPEVVDFLQTLLQEGFLNERSRPMVSFEVKPMEGQDSLMALANAKRMMQQAWALAQ